VTRAGTVHVMAHTDTTPRLLGYSELAAITGYSVDRLRHLKSEGNFPKVCGPGRRVLVHPHDLELWLDGNRRAN